jgi:nicotinamidase/pyrazinamidase
VRALIVTDIQNDFIPGGALAVSEGEAIIPVVNRLQPKFPIVVATQDWHPANHGSFAVNHPRLQIYDTIELNGLPQTLWPVHCVQNSFGARLAPGLNQERIAHVFRKGVDAGIDSYSGFFDNGHLRSTGLDEWLKARNVTDVYVCGLTTDYCVKFTTLDAVQLGFRVNLVEDACRGVNLKAGDVAKAVEEMRQAGVVSTSSAKI